MFCSECGKEIADNSKFCSECGKPISHEKSDNQSNEGKLVNEKEVYTFGNLINLIGKSTKISLSIIVGLVVFIIIIINAFSQNETSANKSHDNNLAERKTAVAVFTEAKEWVETPTPQPSSPKPTKIPTPIPTPTSLDDLRAEIRKNAFVASDKYEGKTLAIVFQVERMIETILYEDDFTNGRYEGPAIVNNDDTRFYCLINNKNEVSDYQVGDFIEVKGRIIKLDDWEIIVSPCAVNSNN